MVRKSRKRDVQNSSSPEVVIEEVSSDNKVCLVDHVWRHKNSGIPTITLSSPTSNVSNATNSAHVSASDDSVLRDLLKGLLSAADINDTNNSQVRSAHTQEILTFLQNNLRLNSRSSSYFVCGLPGTGKTVTVTSLLETQMSNLSKCTTCNNHRLRRRTHEECFDRIDVIKVNAFDALKRQSGSSKIRQGVETFNHLLTEILLKWKIKKKTIQEVLQRRGCLNDWDEVLDKVVKFRPTVKCNRGLMGLIVFIDECDMWDKLKIERDTSLLYGVVRLFVKLQTRACLLLCGNDKDLFNRLGSAFDQLTNEGIVFSPFTVDELSSILISRVSDDSIQKFLSQTESRVALRIISERGFGDCRKLFDLIRNLAGSSSSLFLDTESRVTTHAPPTETLQNNQTTRETNTTHQEDTITTTPSQSITVTSKHFHSLVSKQTRHSWSKWIDAVSSLPLHLEIIAANALLITLDKINDLNSDTFDESQLAIPLQQLQERYVNSCRNLGQVPIGSSKEFRTDCVNQLTNYGILTKVEIESRCVTPKKHSATPLLRSPRFEYMMTPATTLNSVYVDVSPMKNAVSPMKNAVSPLTPVKSTKMSNVLWGASRRQRLQQDFSVWSNGEFVKLTITPHQIEPIFRKIQTLPSTTLKTFKIITAKISSRILLQE